MAADIIKGENQPLTLLAYLKPHSDKLLSLSRSDMKQVIKVVSKEEPEDPDEFGVLVPAKGADETFNNCTACHSERIISQQGLSRKDWAELFEWMVDEQEMEKMEEPDYTLVLDYLSKNYGQGRPNFPK